MIGFPQDTAAVVTTTMVEADRPVNKAASTSTNRNYLVVQADLCALEMEAMLRPDRMMVPTTDMLMCLKSEAEQRGISVAELYDEEVHYKQLARQGAFSREELQMLVETSTGDERLSEGDEESPF